MPNPTSTSWIWSLLALLLVFFCAVQVRPMAAYPGLWSGFGLTPSLWALVIALTVVVRPFSIVWLSGTRFRRVLLLNVLPFALVWDRLLLFIQPPNGLINLGDSTQIVIDELLAPSVGAVPYGDYTPAYTGMLGWLLVPIRHLPSGIDLRMLLVICTANIFALLVPMLVVAISRLLVPDLNRVVIFCSFVACWTICGSDLGYSTPIREFSNFARYLPAVFALWLALRCIPPVKSRGGSLRQVIAGMALGFNALNSADTGLPLLIAMSISLLCLGTRGRLYSSVLPRLLMGSLGFVAVYAILARIADRGLSLSSYIGIRGFAIAGEVYPRNESLSQGFGSHILIFVIPVILLVTITSQQSVTRLDEDSPLRNVFGCTVALWMSALSIKFLAQPHAVAVPSYALPIFLGVLALYALLRSDIRSLLGIRQRVLLAPSVFVFALAAASVLPTSNVNATDEFRRISGRVVNTNDWSVTPVRPADGWTRDALVKEDDFLVEVKKRTDKAMQSGLTVGYFGAFGNTLEFVEDVDNLLGISTPEGFGFDIDFFKIACIPVDRSHVDVIIVYSSKFPCNGYRLDFKESDSRFLIFRRL